ncbi:glycerol-3-phosphate acyltransferase [Marinithermus hydrothermalis]|uniref:Glycerol-3-phosphate acyltransferase n=1 Tax=Marinithermus hydrothermalis (strain DSM 14884 / JCM 11576 / T1) TaxID=869210 RepID=F2NLC5_MARHT|nr:glycerol-3-phosphate acyltransferase [Marinithermus hydrothermalis]AEB11744.1 Glycerol-3-phosphate acyltransferase [Marinithermus hydrothermalis DSM 14884]
MEPLTATVIGYLLGSLPFAYWFGLIQRKNILELGSKNPGALNALRVLGVVPGLMVLLLDVAKGVLAVLYGEAIGGLPGALAAGAASVWGHAYSAWLGFRGGKGIAPAAGVLLAVDPRVFASAFGLWALFTLAARRPYRAAFITAGILPLIALGWSGERAFLLFGLALAAPIALRHLKDLHR